MVEAGVIIEQGGFLHGERERERDRDRETERELKFELELENFILQGL